MKSQNRIFKHVTKLKLLLSCTILLLLTDSLYSQPTSILTSKKAIRYNRVEGLHLGTNIKLFEMNGGKIRTIAFGGYGFSSEELTYGAGINYNSKKATGYAGSLNYSHDISTNDENVMGWLENSTAAFFAKKDFLDYFLTTGARASILYRISRKHEISTKFHSLEYKSISKKDVWSIYELIDSDRKYRNNPAITEERETRVTIGYAFDSRINQFMLTDNFIFNISLEKAGSAFGGYFEYNGLNINLKKYKRTFGSQMLIVRGFLGVRDRKVSEQFLYYLGGIGTLRGYGHKEFTGNRVGMVNVDYLFNRAIFKLLPLKFLPYYPTMGLIAFFDAGWTNHGSDPHLTSRSFESRDVKINIGVGYSLFRDMIRINFAKRLDGGDGIKFTLRFFQRI